MSTRLEVRQFSCLSDNYGFLIHDPESGETAAIDAPDAEAVLREAEEAGWSLTHIFNTHHHFDHSGGNLQIKEATGCRITGPRGEAERIPGLDRLVGEGDKVGLGGLEAEVFETPGHTSGHIVYYFEASGDLFVGDTLFALGCGRLFEGTARQMWGSLLKLKRLPKATRVYCAHEYTQANARFALSVEPGNEALIERARRIDALRGEGKPTVPTTIGLELETNPFLRSDAAGLRRFLGMEDAEEWEVFAETRRRKDSF